MHFSFLAFVFTQVVIDLESAYNLYLDRYPVHRFLHTLPGGLVAAASVILLLLGVRRYVPQFRRWREIVPVAVATGAVIGSVSHSLLDAIMHSDVRLFGPWGATGHMTGLLSLTALHLSCTMAGLLGAIILLLRYARGNETG